MDQAHFVKRIWQVDSTHFAITWTDGCTMVYELAALQRSCPCARCVDENTGERRVSADSIPENRRAKVIRSTGRYALRIEFDGGCSLGIYSFDFLYQFKDAKVLEECNQ